MSARSSPASRRSRAGYFSQIRERLENAVAASGHTPSNAARRVLDGAPLRDADEIGIDYLHRLGDFVTWADCFVLEIELVDALPDNDVWSALQSARVRYEQSVETAEYSEYLKTAAQSSPSAATDVAACRSELRFVVDRLTYVLQMLEPKEAARGRLTTVAVWFMFAGAIVIFGLYAWLYRSPLSSSANFVPPESLFAVCLAGLVGGFVSVQQRLQTPTSIDPLYKTIEFSASGFSIMASPFIGMVFAVVFFMIVLGGFVSGDLFPTFAADRACPHASELNLKAFAACTTPRDASSWARLLFWSFAAGFLERLVPDFLTRLGSVATNAK